MIVYNLNESMLSETRTNEGLLLVAGGLELEFEFAGFLRGGDTEVYRLVPTEKWGLDKYEGGHVYYRRVGVCQLAGTGSLIEKIASHLPVSGELSEFAQFLATLCWDGPGCYRRDESGWWYRFDEDRYADLDRWTDPIRAVSPEDLFKSFNSVRLSDQERTRLESQQRELLRKMGEWIMKLGGGDNVSENQASKIRKKLVRDAHRFGTNHSWLVSKF